MNIPVACLFVFWGTPPKSVAILTQVRMAQDSTRVALGHTRIVTTHGELREVTIEDAAYTDRPVGELLWIRVRVRHWIFDDDLS